MSMNMKLKRLSAYFCLLTVAIPQPTIQAGDSGTPWGWIAALCSAAVVGAAGGAVVVDQSYKSKRAQDQEAEHENKLVTAAETTVEKIKKDGHKLLQLSTFSYRDLAKIDSEQALRDLRDQLHSSLQEVVAKQGQLSKVTGAYGDASKKYYENAQHVHKELAKIESVIKQGQELLNRLFSNKYEPIHRVKELKPFVAGLEGTKAAARNFYDFAIQHYAGRETRDGIKDLPLVCAVEDLTVRLEEVKACKQRLEEHRNSIDWSDEMVKGTLTQLDSWKSSLEYAIQHIARDERYVKQVDVNHNRKMERLNTQAEYKRAEERRLVAERERQEELNRAQQIENDRIRVQTNAKQATTQMINSTANAFNSAADLAKAKEKVERERRKREDLEERLRLEKQRVSDLEKQVKQQKQGQEAEENQEGYCSVHKCHSDRCPDLSCRS